jgi:hypothetical protein
MLLYYHFACSIAKARTFIVVLPLPSFLYFKLTQRIPTQFTKYVFLFDVEYQNKNCNASSRDPLALFKQRWQAWSYCVHPQAGQSAFW